jgi:hypothetical protein
MIDDELESGVRERGGNARCGNHRSSRGILGRKECGRLPKRWPATRRELPLESAGYKCDEKLFALVTSNVRLPRGELRGGMTDLEVGDVGSDF